MGTPTTKSVLDNFLTAFETYLDAGNYASAEIELLKAEARLQAMPSTEQFSWRGSLTSAREALALKRDGAKAGYSRVFADLRNKSRSS